MLEDKTKKAGETAKKSDAVPPVLRKRLIIKKFMVKAVDGPKTVSRMGVFLVGEWKEVPEGIYNDLRRSPGWETKVLEEVL